MNSYFLGIFGAILTKKRAVFVKRAWQMSTFTVDVINLWSEPTSWRIFCRRSELSVRCFLVSWLVTTWRLRAGNYRQQLSRPYCALSHIILATKRRRTEPSQITNRKLHEIVSEHDPIAARRWKRVSREFSLSINVIKTQFPVVDIKLFILLGKDGDRKKYRSWSNHRFCDPAYDATLRFPDKKQRYFLRILTRYIAWVDDQGRHHLLTPIKAAIPLFRALKYHVSTRLHFWSASQQANGSRHVGNYNSLVFLHSPKTKY